MLNCRVTMLRNQCSQATIGSAYTCTYTKLDLAENEKDYGSAVTDTFDAGLEFIIRCHSHIEHNIETATQH